MRCCNKELLLLGAALGLALTPAPLGVPDVPHSPVAAGVGRTNSTPVTVHADLTAAYAAASKDGALVLMEFHAAWCGPCRKLEQDVLGTDDFRQSGGPLHYVSVDVDKDAKTARQFNVDSIPDLALLSADGKIIARRKGYVGPEDFRQWIDEARARAKRGEWEGIAPNGQLRELIEHAANTSLESNQISPLIQLLGNPDPAERSQVRTTLTGLREAAIPPLIDALTNAYLGVRIGASETLRSLAPVAPAVDPWSPPDKLKEAVAALQQWWSETGKLPPTPTAPALDMADERWLTMALEYVANDDPASRTEGMSMLVRLGPAALPAVREASKRSERNGDQRTVWALEEVRWTILVPAEVERLAGNVRHDLARGVSPERQAATERLAKAGRAALPVLGELVRDNDPLVQETALRTSTKIGGRESLTTMAVLLQSGDSNLRMTAAQALGATKKKEAAPYLVAASDDADELVACAAIAALEEIQAKDQSAALIRALADSRWRVRAAAAEVIGKLQLNDAAEALKKSLDDNDAFVVKTALTALQEIGGAPDATQLNALLKRLPGLKSVVIEFLVKQDNEAVAQSVHEIYRDASIEDRTMILRTLSGRDHRDGSRSQDDAYWKPLLMEALTAPEVAVRREAIHFLATRSVTLAAELVTPLLADEDREVREWAARTVLEIAAYDLNVFPAGEESTDGDSQQKKSKSRSSDWLQQHQQWHQRLTGGAGATPSLAVTLALFATGDGKTELPALAAQYANLSPATERDAEVVIGVPVVLKRLTLPEGDGVIEVIARTPSLLATAIASLQNAAAPVRAQLLEPARLCAALEGLPADELGKSVEALLTGRQGTWSLANPDPATVPLLQRMFTSKQPMLRAAAVYAYSHYATNAIAMVRQSLEDGDAGVRVTGVQALIHLESDRARLVEQLGPLLGDSHAEMVRVAALGLLEPEVLQAAGWQYELARFRFGNVDASTSVDSASSDDRPLAPLEEHPAFLDTARKRFEEGAEEESRMVLALLLAQYGDSHGIDRLVQEQSGENQRDAEPLLAGVTLSRDPKYLPYLRSLMTDMKDSWRLREILKALRGMPGDEARQLRTEINRQMREK
jgi:HEAT repeat protein